MRERPVVAEIGPQLNNKNNNNKNRDFDNYNPKEQKSASYPKDF